MRKELSLLFLGTFEFSVSLRIANFMYVGLKRQFPLNVLVRSIAAPSVLATFFIFFLLYARFSNKVDN